MLSKKVRTSLKVLIMLLVFLLSLIYTVKWLDKINLDISRDNVTKLIDNSNNLSNNNVVDDLVKYFIDLDLFDPISALNSNYGGLIAYEENNSIISSGYLVNKTAVNKNDVDQSLKPLVYIYNTHPGEKYSLGDKEEYGINPTVITASHILKDKLYSYKIDSVVEDASVQGILDINNWNYASSYKVTRMFLEQAKVDYPSFEYFIDVHRDSVNRNLSTVEINGKSYAKIMFLVGLDNSKYKDNLLVMNNLNSMLVNSYPGISRGIYEKSGKGVNGVYNQDFSKNCILIEVGGEENNIDEVTNTIEAFTKIFSEYIGGSNG